MKKLCYFLIIPALVTGLFSACSKDGVDGATGPQGSAGAQGNANVKPIFDSTNSSSNWTSVPGNGWYTNFVNPNLSAAFIKEGGIAEVFLSTDKGTVWSALPLNYYPYADSTLNAQMSYIYTTNTVEILFTWSDTKQHTDPVTTFGSTCYFNVVCIAPAIIKKYPGTDWTNYSVINAIPELKQGKG